MRIKITLICLWLQSLFVYAAPVIVLPDHPDNLVFPPGETQAYAAAFLNDIIEKSTGKKLEIVPESMAEKYQERIFIGSTSEAIHHIGDLRKLKPEALVVRSHDNDLILCG